MTEELEKSSTENVTVVTGNFPTVSSLKSEDSTEQLICKTPQKLPKKKSGKPSVSSKSVEAGSERGAGTRAVVLLGLAQVALGAGLVGAGALAVVKGASLSRVGAGLWAGCIAVVTGVVGVLAGINDCYGLNNSSGSGSLTAFLALSLLCLACGNSAAVLAATGLHRDSLRPRAPLSSFEDEMEAWTPVLTNIALLIIASVHCLVCIVSIYHLSKRVCPCFRPKQPFDHNQFDPTFKPVQPCVFHVDEIKKAQDAEKVRGHELCKELEAKLQEESPEFGSANSKEKLVTRWLGRQHAPATVPRPRSKGVRKARKPPQPPLVLLPAHPASTVRIFYLFHILLAWQATNTN
ncbi:jg21260 [Pararge aegeria aegeria]|uniref:Jg21260 protein n=1 Tax=Pararge aegeria aegeria TaxID=348720 RepID=A0A8S4RKM8_9NEOP|nr:jg21260 [Pararge aegeria aegeria]